MSKYKAKIIESKLMLISKDIQIGDVIRSSGEGDGNTNSAYGSYDITKEHKVLHESKSGRGWITDTVMLTKLTSFKVIGEISPDALSYVKEGQEFDEEQISEKWYGREYLPLSTWINHSKNYPDLKKEHFVSSFIYIKGPCDHFH